jgi:hypothetical protein
VVRLDPGDSEGVVVRRDPMACETGAAKTTDVASAAKTKTTAVASAAKTKITDVASAAQTTDMTLNRRQTAVLPLVAPILCLARGRIARHRGRVRQQRPR